MKLLWFGDAACHTGFATVTHSILDHLRRSWDVVVWGINHYEGESHDLPYRVIPTNNRIMPDLFGKVLNAEQPDAVVILNDLWVACNYPVECQTRGIPCVAYCPVDMPHLPIHETRKMSGYDLVATYTEFGRLEMLKAGLDPAASMAVIPHGIDAETFKAIPRDEARRRLFGDRIGPDDFVVGCVGRNQPRKRLDLTFRHFAEFAADKPDARLVVHCARRDAGWNLPSLARLYGITDKVILPDERYTPGRGLPRDELPALYSCFDVQMSTTLGEGWGLTHMEAAACGVPQVVPAWSGLGEWGLGGFDFVRCSDHEVMTLGLGTVGGVIDGPALVSALDRHYFDESYRQWVGARGRALVTQERFHWESAADQFHLLLLSVSAKSNAGKGM